MALKLSELEDRYLTKEDKINVVDWIKRARPWIEAHLDGTVMSTLEDQEEIEQLLSEVTL